MQGPAVNNAPSERQEPVLSEKAEAPMINTGITDVSAPGEDAASSDYLKLVPVLEDRLETPSLGQPGKLHPAARNNWPIAILLFMVMVLVTVVAGLYQSTPELFDGVLESQDDRIEIHPVELDRVIRRPEPDVAETEEPDSHAEISPLDQSQVVDEAEEASTATVESQDQATIEEE